ncbi:MAG: PilZ domain-containing protein [Fimbriimonadaceae bacterium]|nr:PilZ domain-containing protein [Fimbriimonadaceae bacterium]
MVRSAPKGHPFRALVIDVSLGGLLLRSEHNFTGGETIEIQIAQERGDAVTVEAEVRHSTVVEGSQFFLCGARFLPKTHDQRVAIVHYVHDAFRTGADKMMVSDMANAQS